LKVASELDMQRYAWSFRVTLAQIDLSLKWLHEEAAWLDVQFLSLPCVLLIKHAGLGRK
jgi:hypothetical protein